MEIVSAKAIVPLTPAYAMSAAMESEREGELRPVLLCATRDRKSEGTIYKAIIRDEISEPHHYLQLMEVMRTMRPIDTMELTLMSPGGMVWTGVSIIDAMLESQGTITTIAAGEIASMAAYIWSFGDQIQIMPNAKVMYHMSSHGDVNNSVKIVDRAIGVITYINDLLEMIKANGLITDEEIALVNDARDLYMTAETLQPRLDAYNQARRVSNDV